jgi:hypothetical protein
LSFSCDNIINIVIDNNDFSINNESRSNIVLPFGSPLKQTKRVKPTKSRHASGEFLNYSIHLHSFSIDETLNGESDYLVLPENEQSMLSLSSYRILSSCSPFNL